MLAATATKQARAYNGRAREAGTEAGSHEEIESVGSSRAAALASQGVADRSADGLAPRRKLDRDGKLQTVARPVLADRAIERNSDPSLGLVRLAENQG